MIQNTLSDAVTESVLKAISDCLVSKPYITVAIDGRCASGKTTLAAKLADRLPCSCEVFHMDDFFLRPEQRTEERLRTPGENVDHERFLDEVLLPLRAHRPFSYRPYDCHTQSLMAPVSVKPARVFLVEGSYACHPALWDHYDLHILLDITPERQWTRLLARNGREGAERFRQCWIPLEEAYFAAADLRARCELVFD